MASVLSASRQHIMLGEWRQSSLYSLSTAFTYFTHIFYIISCILVRTKVLNTVLLLFTPKARVISVIFRGEHRKIDAELLAYLHLPKNLKKCHDLTFGCRLC